MPTHAILSTQVKRHMFFGSIDWERMMRRELRSPWQPTFVGSVDTSQFDLEFTSMPIFSPGDRGGLYYICLSFLIPLAHVTGLEMSRPLSALEAVASK
jgi:hypothetical protein